MVLHEDITDLGTPAGGDTVIIKDVSDSDNAKEVTLTNILGVPHNHSASEITSGTLTHERGGLELDVSAVSGLIAISGGTTSAVSTKANLEAQISDVADFAEADGDTYTGIHDFGGATSLEIPNGATPTVDAAGEVAVDTTITDHTGLIKYHDGVEELTVIALPTANLTATDGHVPAYNATNNEFEMVAQSGGGGTEYIIISGHGEGNSVGASNTGYFHFGGANADTGSEVNDFPCPVTGTIVRFGFNIRTNNGNTGNSTFTVRVGTTDTALEVAVAAAASGNFSDTGSVAVTQDDFIRVKNVSGYGTGSAALDGFYIVIEVTSV